MVSLPSDFGSASMKSIVTCYQAISGMGKGCRSLGYGMFSALLS
jgi:hypothetical protein